LHARGVAEGSKKGRLLLREATRKRGGRSSSVKCEKKKLNSNSLLFQVNM
jgi:hypothetical protein